MQSVRWKVRYLDGVTNKWRTYTFSHKSSAEEARGMIPRGSEVGTERLLGSESVLRDSVTKPGTDA
jgi:hypothetical protein